MDAIALHYYTILGPRWENKDTAIGFSEAGWINTLANTLKMDGFIKNRTPSCQPSKQSGSAARRARRWVCTSTSGGPGTSPNPGSNPGFLVQQNTLRDAVVAAANFNIFHKYADRVRMTAIAQTINVLQAMILTDGPKMILTPTYHVFHMYKPFQDAVSLPIEIETGTYKYDTVVGAAGQRLGGQGQGWFHRDRSGKSRSAQSRRRVDSDCRGSGRTGARAKC